LLRRQSSVLGRVQRYPAATGDPASASCSGAILWASFLSAVKCGVSNTLLACQNGGRVVGVALTLNP
jgi:hypothetical protein